MKTITYTLHGKTKLPKKFINAIPRSGQADSSVADLRTMYNVECNPSHLVEYLKSYGSWGDSELQNHDDNIDRLIWLSCLDCQENNTNYFYMGN
jgi:hypothetical protein